MRLCDREAFILGPLMKASRPYEIPLQRSSESHSYTISNHWTMLNAVRSFLGIHGFVLLWLTLVDHCLTNFDWRLTFSGFGFASLDSFVLFRFSCPGNPDGRSIGSRRGKFKATCSLTFDRQEIKDIMQAQVTCLLQDIMKDCLHTAFNIQE
ncbi:hypothetical protein Tco_0774520 [Tanacetum coccineum]|uniref:Uncharacterized protein n=1 Tax=Tanacetum coccineum TaxID=301880 RepID=A0ABQ4ZNU8_9ASTR